jgi:hypothetical protein
MGYTSAPFNPSNPYPNQVATELNLANQNFTILSQAFLNNDPTTGVIKSSVYTFRRVDLTNATSDYMLQVGEEAIYTFSSSSAPINVPLHIATDPYGVYLILIFDYMTSQPNSDLGHYSLNANNTTYDNAFKNNFIDFSEGSSSLEFVSYTTYNFAFDKFPGGVGFVLVNVYNRVALFDNSTNIAVNGNYPGNRKVGTARWTDKSTDWTSLGTMKCNSTGGLILVRRLA